MIVRINGVPLASPAATFETKVVIRPNPKLKRLAITLWTLSGSLFTNQALAASSNMEYVLEVWKMFMPGFGTLQGYALMVGILALIIGGVMVLYWKRWGKLTIFTGIGIIVGTALVPAMALLLFFLGGKMSDAIIHGIETAVNGK